MNKLFLFTTLIALIIIVPACGGDTCRNSNKILATYGVDEALYKIELGKVFKEGFPKNAHFYFEELRENYSDTILVGKLKAEKICVILQTKVKSWRGIEEIKKSLGHDMKGTEIVDYVITMSDSLTIPIFYFRGAKGISK